MQGNAALPRGQRGPKRPQAEKGSEWASAARAHNIGKVSANAETNVDLADPADRSRCRPTNPVGQHRWRRQSWRSNWKPNWQRIEITEEKPPDFRLQLYYKPLGQRDPPVVVQQSGGNRRHEGKRGHGARRVEKGRKGPLQGPDQPLRLGATRCREANDGEALSSDPSAGLSSTTHRTAWNTARSGLGDHDRAGQGQTTGDHHGDVSASDLRYFSALVGMIRAKAEEWPSFALDRQV